MTASKSFFYFLSVTFCFLAPELSLATVESTLANAQATLYAILPVVGAIGIVWAAISFFTGNPNARNHLTLAIIGAIVGFGAPSIIEFIRGIVH